MALPGFYLTTLALRYAALAALTGVGNAQLGQWEEYTDTAYHVRRRLSRDEQKQVGDAMDIRGTPEAVERYSSIERYLPPALKGQIE
jgi:hypothetical protein